jgi:CBS domain containing-hemolysin-like protein
MISDNPEPENSNLLFHKILKIIKTSIKLDKEKTCSSQLDELDSSLKEMIKGIIKLSDRISRDIMIPRVDIDAVDIKTELMDLVKIVCDAGHSRVPVFEKTIDNIIGILYVKDLIKLLANKSRAKFQLKKILHDPHFVPETMPLDELLREFKIRKQHMAVVIDEYGGIAGIVTMEDILEEIVGDISDEYDSEELPEIEQIGKYTYEVDSRLSIIDFNETTGLNIPDIEYDTIGGYVLDLFGKIPKKDDSVKAGEATFKIKEIEGTVINRIIATISKNR